MSEGFHEEEDAGPEPTLDFNDPTPDLGSRVVKRGPEMDDLIARAMSGLLPRSRSLKPWEPATLDERHLQIVMMRATGMKQNAIASLLGLQQAWVSVVLNHPDAQYLLTKIVGYAADEVLDVQQRIAAHAGEALDKVVEVMRTTQDQRLASANAFELLRMAGHGETKKVSVQAEIAVGKAQVDLLAEAIAEAQQLSAVEGVDYRILASGSGNVSGESPETAVDSGNSSTGLPPGSDSSQSEASDRRVA